MKYYRNYNSGEQDASIAATTMMYEAEELGVHTIWIRGFDSKTVVETFGLPDSMSLEEKQKHFYLKVTFLSHGTQNFFYYSIEQYTNGVGYFASSSGVYPKASRFSFWVRKSALLILRHSTSRLFVRADMESKSYHNCKSVLKII